MQDVAVAFQHLTAGIVAIAVHQQGDVAVSLANHIAAGAFGGEGEVVALAVAPGDAEAVKGDNVARRVGGNGAQHHHRHALALQIVDHRRLLYRIADILDQQAFIQPFQRLREQRQ